VRPVSTGLTTPAPDSCDCSARGSSSSREKHPVLGQKTRCSPSCRCRECAGPGRFPESPCSTDECLRRSGAHPPIHVAVQPERNVSRAAHRRATLQHKCRGIGRFLNSGAASDSAEATRSNVHARSPWCSVRCDARGSITPKAQLGHPAARYASPRNGIERPTQRNTRVGGL
jgi:hypothetical protein